MLKTKAIKAGTGEAYCSTPEYTRVRLLNTEISHKQMTTFVELIKPHYPALKPFRIFFINRPVKYQYGVARMEIRELHINRRAVWVFLHELVHFIAWDIYRTDSHGHTFAKCLDRLYLLWEANKDKLTNLQ